MGRSSGHGGALRGRHCILFDLSRVDWAELGLILTVSDNLRTQKRTGYTHYLTTKSVHPYIEKYLWYILLGLPRRRLLQQIRVAIQRPPDQTNHLPDVVRREKACPKTSHGGTKPSIRC